MLYGKISSLNKGIAAVYIVMLIIISSTFAAQNRQVHLNIIGQTRKPLL